MTDTTSLGDRMKTYEHATRTILPARTYTIVRVDGRAFSTYLRGADKPFDAGVIAAMDETTAALCQAMSGAVLAYTQSDEVSILLTDFGRDTTQAWFAGVTQKIASVSASTATATFNRSYRRDVAAAVFDGRVYTIDDPVEVANYFVWRQRDAQRNAVSMAAHAKFGHARLQHVNTGRAKAMLADAGIDFDADYPAGARMGRVCHRVPTVEPVTYVDRRTGDTVTLPAVERRVWRVEAAPAFTAAPAGWLGSLIPAREEVSA